jgi:hypothetical protein
MAFSEMDHQRRKIPPHPFPLPEDEERGFMVKVEAYGFMTIRGEMDERNFRTCSRVVSVRLSRICSFG